MNHFVLFSCRKKSKIVASIVSSNSKENETIADASYYEVVDDLRPEEICKEKKLAHVRWPETRGKKKAKGLVE